jgi:hypothetical protein
MRYVSTDANGLRLVNVTTLETLPPEVRDFSEGSILSLMEPALEVSVPQAAYTVDITYPLSGDRAQLVSAIGLLPAAYSQIASQLDNAASLLVEEHAGVRILAVVPQAVSGSSTSRSGYLALNGQDLLYARGTQAALDKLRSSLDAYLAGQSSMFDSSTLQAGYYAATTDPALSLGVSVTNFATNVQGVHYVVKSVSLDGGNLLVRQLLVFDSPGEMERNFESAKTLFTSPRETVCRAAHVISSRATEPVADLRKIMQGL